MSVSDRGSPYDTHRRSDELIRRISRRLIDPRWKAASFEDRLTLAQNLMDLLEDPALRAAGVGKAQVLQKAGQGNEGESTKRLHYFAIRRGLDRPELERRGAKLRKKVAGYVKIADAVAQIAKWPDDEYRLRLFTGTRYMEDGAADPEVDMHVLAVTDTLQKLGNFIARHPSIPRYFEQMAHGVFGFSQLLGGIPHINGYRADLGEIRDRRFAYCGDCWGLPALPLYDLPFGAPCRARLRVDEQLPLPIDRLRAAAPTISDFVSPPVGPGWFHPLLVLQEDSTDGDEWRPVAICARVSVWFVLAPLGKAGAPIPAFQARVLLEVYDGETPIQLALPHWNEDPRILIRTPDGLRRAWLVPDDAVPIMDGDDPLGAKSTELTGFTRFTSNYFYHERVDARSCKKFLDVVPNLNWSLFDWTAPTNIPTDCPPGTVGSFLLANLANPEGPHLDDLLRGAAENLIQQADAIVRGGRGQIHDALDRLMHKWTTTEPD
jgi:hypothetical protein